MPTSTPETVTLTLSNVVSDDAQATLGTQTTTTVTINDDRKQTVTIAADPAVINEGVVDTTSTVTVTLTPAPTGTATVNIPITVSPGSGDFTLTGLTNRRVTIDSSGTATFTVAPKDDDKNTTDQTVTFGFGGLPGNVKLGAKNTQTAKVTVRDSTRPILSFGAAAYTAIENGDAAIVELTLSMPYDKEVMVPITTDPATGDFLLSTREVVFAAGEQRKTVTVTAAQDDDIHSRFGDIDRSQLFTGGFSDVPGRHHRGRASLHHRDPG